MIPFHQPSITQLEEKYIKEALASGFIHGDGVFAEKVSEIFRNKLGINDLFLTTSGTHSLELAAILSEIGPGDEFIVPSYTFSSTVNAFMLRGAKPVFCDIREDTLNIDENKIEELITPKTKVIVTVDYAGVSCEYDEINKIAKKHELLVVDDAAQAVGSTYKGQPSGTQTPITCFSFHETKNYTMGEGGAIVINDKSYRDRALIIREKGTDRRAMMEGLIDKYSWRDMGSSFVPSEILAALLLAQMERFEEIMEKRISRWDIYHALFEEDEKKGRIRRQFIPEHCQHNAHMYYILLQSKTERSALISYLKERGISSTFHYVPLHTAPFGLEQGNKVGDLPITEDLEGKLLRLPLFADMKDEEVERVVSEVRNFLY